MTDGVTARAPAHLTAFFAPEAADDPARAGATGGGLALADGIEVTVAARAGSGDDSHSGREPPARDATGGAGGSPHRVTLNGESATVAPVTGVLERLDVPPARVAIDAAVPVGAGFGVSGGATLATAFAAASRFGLARTANTLIGAAHAAEVAAETGLGDVVAAARGGIPLRLAAGGPTHGAMDGIPGQPRIEYVSFGELSTPDVLGGETDRVTVAGERALESVVATPTVEQIFRAGRRFTERVELADDRVRETIEAVESAGGEATMAMLGRTVVALGTGLSDAGYDAEVCSVDPTGVRVLSDG